MANQIKFYKGASFASYVEGGVYFETSTGLIKVGRAGGVDAFGGDVKDAVLADKKLTISFNSGKDDVVCDFSDCASATAVSAQISGLAGRVKAIEDDYLKGADKTELANKAKAAQDDVDALETLVGELPESSTATTVIGYIDEKAAEVAAKAGVVSMASATAGNYITVGVDKSTGDVALTLDETKLDAAVKAAKKAGDDAQSALDTYKTSNDAAVEAAQDAADAAQGEVDALEALVGTPDTGKTIQGEIDAVEAKVEALEAAKVSVKNADADAHIKVEGNTAGTEYTVSGVDIASAAALATAEGKINTLIGSVAGDDSKSVREIANDELAKQLIAENAAESLDSLKEIADWIQSHPGEASAMNSAISDLQKLHATGESVADEVAAGIAAIESASATGSDNGVQVIVSTEAGSVKSVSVDATTLAGRVSALEGLFTGDDSVDAKIATAKSEAIAAAATAAASADEVVLQNAKKYADDLADNYATAAQGEKADSALQSVSASAAGSTFVSATAAAKADNAQAISISVTMGTMAADKMTVATDGLATVADVANAVAAGISATTLVGASAEDGDVKVTVSNGEISAELSWAMFE